jgi:hypothetical protein
MASLTFVHQAFILPGPKGPGSMWSDVLFCVMERCILQMNPDLPPELILHIFKLSCPETRIKLAEALPSELYVDWHKCLLEDYPAFDCSKIKNRYDAAYSYRLLTRGIEIRDNNGHLCHFNFPLVRHDCPNVADKWFYPLELISSFFLTFDLENSIILALDHHGEPYDFYYLNDANKIPNLADHCPPLPSAIFIIHGGRANYYIRQQASEMIRFQDLPHLNAPNFEEFHTLMIKEKRKLLHRAIKFCMTVECQKIEIELDKAYKIIKRGFHNVIIYKYEGF